MPQAVGEIGLRGTVLDAMLLPRGVRTVTAATITAQTAIAEGARQASLRSSVSVNVTAGTGLSFNVTTPTGATRRKQVIVRQDVTLTNTPQTVTIFPAIEAVAANETAQYIPGLVPVFGLQDFSFQSQDTTVDTTDSLSGAGTEVAIVRSGLEFTISVIERIADLGLTNVIKPVALDFAFKGREIFARLMYPDGETHQGAAKVMNYSQAGNQNEVKRANWTLQFQGESYEFIKAYTFGTFTPQPGGGGGAPQVFDTILTFDNPGPVAQLTAVGFQEDDGNEFRIDAISGVSGTAISADLTIDGTAVLAINTLSGYNGALFNLLWEGVLYSGTLANGTVNVTAIG
jgi:hypothetical protein